jgi:bilirubin oxidase
MVFTQIQTTPPMFAINGKTMDLSVIDETMTLDDIEIWDMVNQTGTAHPFHIHDLFFYVLDRNGQPPPPEERGPKDTVMVGAGESVRVITQYRDHLTDPGFPFMYHCHMLSHEDEGMMGQWEVVP